MCWKVVPNDDIGMKFNRGNPPIRGSVTTRWDSKVIRTRQAYSNTDL